MKSSGHCSNSSAGSAFPAHTWLGKGSSPAGNDLSLLLPQTNRKGKFVHHMRSPGIERQGKRKECLDSFSDLSCFFVIGMKNSEFGSFSNSSNSTSAKMESHFIAASFLQRLFAFQACTVQARSQGRSLLLFTALFTFQIRGN